MTDRWPAAVRKGPEREFRGDDRSRESIGSDPAWTLRIGGACVFEGTKLKSVRSTVWTLLVTAFVGVGLSAIVTSAGRLRWGRSRTL